MAMAKRRGFEGVGDMTRSLGLVLLVVAAIVLFTLRSTPDEPIPTVDPAETFAAAAAAGLPVFKADVPEGWRVTSARFEEAPPQRYAVGYLTADEDFAGYGVTADVDDLVDEFVRDAEAGGTVTVADRTWEVYAGPDRLAWVTELPDESGWLVVSGSDPALMTQLAESLIPA
jgi:hypothetical protein